MEKCGDNCYEPTGDGEFRQTSEVSVSWSDGGSATSGAKRCRSQPSRPRKPSSRYNEPWSSHT